MADSSEVRALLLQINANTELLRSNLSEAEKAIAAFHASTEKHLDDTDKKFEAFGKGLEKLEAPLERLKSLGEIATATLIGESFVEAGKRALEFAGNVGFVSQQVGTSTTFLQQYRYAASQFGVGTQAADEGLGKFNRSIGEVANGNKEMIALFDRLGVKVFDAGGKVRSTDVIFGEFANAISRVGSPAEQTADTLTAFGRGAIGLVPLLRGGADGFNDLAHAANALGVVLSPELIEHSEDVNHKLSALKQVLDAEMASAIARNAVQLEGLATSIVSVASALAKLASSHPQATLAAIGFALGGPAGALVGAGLGSGEVDKQIAGSAAISQRIANTKAPAGLGMIPGFSLLMRGAGAVAPLFYSHDELVAAAPRAPSEGGERRPGAASPVSAGVTNNGGQALKKAQADLADLERLKAGASGAALTAYNEEITAKRREIGFLKQGADAELAKSLASKEGAAITKGENEAKKAARKAEEDRRKALQDDLAYRKEELDLRKKILEGAKASTGNDAARDQLQRDIINAEADTLKATVADKLAKGGYGADPKVAQARATNILQLNEQNRQQGLANVDLQRAVQVQKDATTRAALELQGQIDLLGLDERLAITRKERLALELRLLDLQEQQARAAQQAIIDSKDPKVTEADRANARTRLGQIDEQHAGNVTAIQRQNEAPLAAYKQQLQGAVGDTNDALQGIEVGGLQNLESAFQGILSGSQSVSSAIKSMVTSVLADLAKLAVEKGILSALGSLLPGGGSGLSIDPSATSFAGLGAGIQAHAAGGHITGPGTGTSDSILARLSTGEFVMNAASTKQFLPLLHAMNDNRLPGYAEGGVVGAMPSVNYPRISTADVRRAAIPHVTIGVEANDYFDAKVTRISSGLDSRAAPSVAAAGASLAQANATRAGRRRLA